MCGRDSTGSAMDGSSDREELEGSAFGKVRRGTEGSADRSVSIQGVVEMASGGNGTGKPEGLSEANY